MLREGPRHDCQQCSLEQGMIVRKILRELAGSGIDGHAVARGQSAEKPRR